MAFDMTQARKAQASVKAQGFIFSLNGPDADDALDEIDLWKGQEMAISLVCDDRTRERDEARELLAQILKEVPPGHYHGPFSSCIRCQLDSLLGVPA